MQTSESLKRKIQSAQDLLGVVKTMKALAAVSIRQYQKAVESLAEYNRTVEMGLQIVLQAEPGQFCPDAIVDGERMGAIVFGTDQGLCGQLNNIVTAHAIGGDERPGDREREPHHHCRRHAGGRHPRGFGAEGPGNPQHPRLDGRHHAHGAGHHLGARGLAIQKTDREHVPLLQRIYFRGELPAEDAQASFPSRRTWLKSLEKRKWESRTLPMFTDGLGDAVPRP